MGGKNKRDHLINVGQEVIWSKGYDLCSIKDITTAAGLPKGSFYHYFESKEKFALEAMHEFIREHKEENPTNKSSLSSLKKIIDLRIEAISKISFARECYMSVMCHAYSEQDEEFRIEVLQALEDSNATVNQLLSDLKSKGAIKSSLKLEELTEFVDFAWRGARLKARLLKSDKPLKIFKKYLLEIIQPA